MFNFPTDTLPGTKVIEAKKYLDNPAKEPEQYRFFHDGYWKIVVSSDGRNPFFTRGSTTIVLLSQVDENMNLHLAKNWDTYISIQVEPEVEIEKISTKIDFVQDENDAWEIPAIVIEVSSKTKGHEQIKCMWDAERLIENLPQTNYTSIKADTVGVRLFSFDFKGHRY